VDSLTWDPYEISDPAYARLVLDLQNYRAFQDIEEFVRVMVVLWFANNTCETKPYRFSFLAARLRSAMPSATAGNNVTWPSLCCI
jgi:hypothetical protein